MSYALPADVRAFTTNVRVLALDDATLAKYIAQAEPLIDKATGFAPFDASTPRRFDPPTMLEADRSVLTRATAAQVEYAVLMGDDYFTRPGFKSVSGPEFSYTNDSSEPQRIGQRVYDELFGSSIMRLSTSWRGEGAAPAWESFAYNIEND